MKKFIFILLIPVITNCTLSNNKDDVQNDFEQLKEGFLSALWESSPGYASWAGLHEYDSLLSINTKKNRESSEELLDSIDKLLSEFPEKELNKLDQIDYRLMRDFIQSARWYNNTFKSYEWNPAETNVGWNIGNIVNGKYAGLTERLKVLSAMLKQVPEYYRVGLKNIKKPTKEHLTLAVEQNKGVLSLLGSSLTDSISISNLSEWEKDILINRIEVAKEAINSYVEGLDSISGLNNFRSSRIGKELFEEKYGHDINADFTAEDIYNKALEERKSLHSQMIEISETLWPIYLSTEKKPEDSLELVKMVIDKIAENHVEKDSFFVEIKKQINQLWEFVDEKDLLTQDKTKPLLVRETPEYMRGFAGASISAPGPFVENGTTYYNVTPLDDYTDEEAESYLREYNDYILQILNIHEAIPGHYTQLVYANKSPSVIKSVLYNGAMVEGWANYTETMMLEEGYNTSPEMWLMRNKWHLRGVTNTLLDYSYHVLGLTKEEAMKMMMKEAFQEKTEAEGKWRRLTLSSVQLSSYFSGFTQIYSLRNELKAKKGENFNLKEFHEEFLGYGNSPVKYIREYMLEN